MSFTESKLQKVPDRPDPPDRLSYALVTSGCVSEANILQNRKGYTKLLEFLSVLALFIFKKFITIKSSSLDSTNIHITFITK